MPRLCPTCSRSFETTAELMLHRRIDSCIPMDIDEIMMTEPLLTSRSYGSFSQLPTAAPEILPYYDEVVGRSAFDTSPGNPLAINRYTNILSTLDSSSTSSSSPSSPQIINPKGTPAPEGTPEEKICLICMTNLKNALLSHGSDGHMVTCIECAYQLIANDHTCPVCRKEIKKVIKVFE